MSSIKHYLKISSEAKRINKLFESPVDFIQNYKNLEYSERVSYLKHILINNCPFLFMSKPILYERVIQYLAEELEIEFSDVRLIGSAKTGFSISPHPNFGKDFTKDSDLDFTIVNMNLFNKLSGEFNLFSDLYTNKKIIPKDSEKKYWDNNCNLVPRNIRNGFIDSNRIPNRKDFQLTQRISSNLYLLQYKLEEYHQIVVSKASLRVYKDWESFISQLKTNTDYVLESMSFNNQQS